MIKKFSDIFSMKYTALIFCAIFLFFGLTAKASAATVPANSVLPVINGTPAPGQSLVTSNGIWSGTPTPTYSYQWKKDGVAIDGAVASSYLVTSGEIGTEIIVTVTASNSAGGASVTSASTDPVTVGALSLLHGETSGFAADFTYSDISKRIAVKGHTSGNGEYAPDDFFLSFGGSPKRVTDVTGARVWASHNQLLQSENFTQTWGVSGTPIVTTHTIEDNNAAAASYLSQTVSLIVGAPYTATFNILKDSNQTVFPAILVLSSTQAIISINTVTGAVSSAQSNTLGATYSVEDVGAYWKLKITFSAAAISSSFRIYPAYSTSLGGAVNNSAVRAVEIDSSQLNRGSTPTTYLHTTSVARFGLAEDFDPVTHLSRGVLMENQGRTNLLLNTYTDLVTQSVSVSAIPYTLSFYGTGTVTLSGVSTAGPLVGTGANERVSLTFTPTAGTLTVTVSGTVSEAQLEAGATATSQIPTWSTSVSRAGDSLSIALASIPDLGSAWTIYTDFIYTTPTVNNQYLFSFANGLAELAGVRIDSTATLGNVTDNSVSQASIQLPAISANVRNEMTVRFQTNNIAASINGAPIGLGQDVSATMPTPSTFYIDGQAGPGNGLVGSLYVRRIVIVPRGVDDINLSDWRYARTSASDAYDIFLVAGQSNTQSGTPLDSLADVSGGRVFQMAESGVVSAANEPLKWPRPIPPDNAIGFALPFARDYYVPNVLESGRNVLLLPTAISNTGFSDTRWNADNDLYNYSTNMAAVALNAYPNSVFKGILWMQGEREAQVAWTESQYANAFDAMVAGFRAKFGNIPVVVGGMAPGWVAADSTRQPVQDALINTPNRLSNSGYADPASPTNISLDIGTTVHYSAADQRIFGSRYWTAYSPLLVSKPSITPTNLSASSNSNSVTLSVDSFPNDTSGSSGYYFSNSSGNNSGWIQTNSWTDAGLSCGHSYDYSVIYRNGDGTETNSISTTKSTNGCPNSSGGHSHERAIALGLIPPSTITTSSTTSTNLTSLQDQIASLTLELNSLQTQGNITGTGNTPYNFTRNLSLHATGADVKLLQQFLNTHGFTLITGVDSTGSPQAGSPLNETTLFGLLTYKALVTFQKSVGLPATGWFGPMTRGVIQNMGK